MNRGQLAGVARNPRRITREGLSTLCRSIASDPEMLEARELIVYPLGEEYVIIGGNARYEAIKKLGISSVPCKVLPADMPVSKLRAIAIKDNISSGAWDVELLLSDWDTDMLVDWGLDFEEPQVRNRQGTEKVWIPKSQIENGSLSEWISSQKRDSIIDRGLYGNHIIDVSGRFYDATGREIPVKASSREQQWRAERDQRRQDNRARAQQNRADLIARARANGYRAHGRMKTRTLEAMAAGTYRGGRR